ncbi:ribonuclease III [[Mycoplasma] imitans]|uniref:ribonuclease III n=1 Tax=[Mycoplasma] imitans TaxID=29560 RepID=UPI000487165C|nr:ribonuclease III [[Mycoplasma] imitans]
MDNLEKNTKKESKKSKNFKRNPKAKKAKNIKEKTEVVKPEKPTPRMFKMTPKSSKFLHQLGVTGRKHTEKPVPLNDPDYEKKIREIQAKEAKKIRSDEVINKNSKKQKNNKQAKKKSNKNNKPKVNNNNFSNSKKRDGWKQKAVDNKKEKNNRNSAKPASNTAINLIIKKSFETTKQNNLIAPDLKQNKNKKNQQLNSNNQHNNQNQLKKIKNKKTESLKVQPVVKQTKTIDFKSNESKQEETKKKLSLENKNLQNKPVNFNNLNNPQQKNNRNPDANRKVKNLNQNNNKKNDDLKKQSSNIQFLKKNISDQEIAKITNYIKDNYPVIYDDLKQKTSVDFNNSNLDDQNFVVYVNYEAKDLELLLKKFKIVTNNIGLYEEALTHNSYSNEMKLKYNYQRLEFLGDAIINKVVAEYLFNHSDSSEGEMTKDRIKIIQSKTLIKAASQLELINYIRVGEGLKIVPLSPKILEDIFESFIGAMYLDQGEYAVRKVLNDTIIGYYQKGQLTENTDYKSIFQEIIHSTGLNMKIHYDKNYDHNSNLYSVNLYAGGIMYGQGKDVNTHKAEVKAAKDAISKFRGLLKL